MGSTSAVTFSLWWSARSSSEIIGPEMEEFGLASAPLCSDVVDVHMTTPMLLPDEFVAFAKLRGICATAGLVTDSATTGASASFSAERFSTVMLTVSVASTIGGSSSVIESASVSPTELIVSRNWSSSACCSVWPV
eukprot:1205725-Prymnesium_polylepis.1